MNSVLMWIGGTLVAILSALFIGPHLVDWNGYRGVFEEEATRILGRQVRVGGDVNLRLLPSPYVKFEQLSIADTSGLTGAPLFAADNFTMWLAVPPLLKGIFEANRIELNKPVVRLAATQDGRGNWQNVSIRSGALPFVPAGVALHSVRIRDGVVGFETEAGGPLIEIKNINGELSAKALSGPYTFRGTANVLDAERSVKLVTTEAGTDGAVRLKASLVDAEKGDLYKLEGRLTDTSSQPRFDGRIVASYRLAELGDDVSLSVKSTIEAVPEHAKLADILASFENVGHPQLITGDAQFEWNRGHKLVLNLSSQWLNLDRLSGYAPALPPESAQANDSNGESETEQTATKSTSKPPLPFATTQGLLEAIVSRLPQDSAVDAKFEVDQVELGRDAVSNVVMHLRRQSGPLRLKTFRARLPGGGRLEYSGALTRDDGGVGTSGDVFVGGPSLARLLKWANPTGDSDGSISDGPFSVAGDLKLSQHFFELGNGRAEFSGVPVRGSVKHVGGESSSLEISLDGYTLDTRWIGLEPIRLATLAEGLGIASSEAVAQDASSENVRPSMHWATSMADELKIKIRAGRLINGGLALQDVDADFAVRKEAVVVPKFKFLTEEGLQLELEGAIRDVGEKAKGELHWVASATTSSALTPVAEVFQSDEGRADNVGWLSNLAPFRLAGRLSIGEENSNSALARIDMDGVVRGARTVVHAELEGGLSSWRSSPASVTIDIDSPDDKQVIALLGGQVPRDLGQSDELGLPSTRIAGRGLFKAVGIPKSGMQAMASLQSDRITLIYNGRVGLSDERAVALSLTKGEMVVFAKDARHFLNLAGLNVASGSGDVALNGLFDVERRANEFRLTARDVRVGAATLAGRFTLSPEVQAGGQDGQRLDAQLVVDKASVRGLLSGLLAKKTLSQSLSDVSEISKKTDVASKDDKRTKGKPKMDAGQAGEGLQNVVDVFSDENSIFPDQAFDMSPLQSIKGRLDLKVGALGFGDGLSLSDADITADLAPRKVVVELAGQTSGGGKLTSILLFRKQLAGVGLSGDFNIKKLSLAELGRSSKKPAPAQKGEAQVHARFSGQALGPRALLSVLKGKGEIQLRDAALQGMSPRLVQKAANDVIKEGELTNDGLKTAILAQLDEGALAIGTRTIPIDVVDGAVKLAPVGVKSKGGNTSAEVVLDIATLNVDSEWTLVSNSNVAGKSPWPAITVKYQGPIAKLGALEPKISSGALQRELAVRSLERNVDELERLRKEDEAAGRRQRERLRRLEEEQEKARRAEEAARLRRSDELVVEDLEEPAGSPSGRAGNPGEQGQDDGQDAEAGASTDAEQDGDRAGQRARRRRRKKYTAPRPRRVQRQRSRSPGEILQQQF